MKEQKSRAVFAPADYPLLKNALECYAKQNDLEKDELKRIASLMHRLGRINDC